MPISKAKNNGAKTLVGQEARHPDRDQGGNRADTAGDRRRVATPAGSGSGSSEALAHLENETARLRQELMEARARIAELERLADEDALVPIPNRRAFVRELSRAIAFAKRYGQPSSVIYFDVNGMKRINDAHGHLAGDAALRHVAGILRDNIRSIDTLGRLGGDEFGVILTQAGAEQANAKAAVLAEKVAAAPLRWDDRDIPVTAAYGVYSFDGSGDAQIAIDAADRAMYRQKRGDDLADLHLAPP